MSEFTQDDLAQGVGQLLIEFWALQKRFRELQPAPSPNGRADLADLPRPTSAAQRAADEKPEG